MSWKPFYVDKTGKTSIVKPTGMRDCYRKRCKGRQRGRDVRKVVREIVVVYNCFRQRYDAILMQSCFIMEINIMIRVENFSVQRAIAAIGW